MLGSLTAISAERARNISPVVLAFIGDAVYSLYVRHTLALNSDSKSGGLHKLASVSVSATAQSGYAEKLLPHLNADELIIYKRARNAKKSTKSKNSSVADYNRSTGFEAVIGYLYMTGQQERLKIILSSGEEHDN